MRNQLHLFKNLIFFRCNNIKWLQFSHVSHSCYGGFTRQAVAQLMANPTSLFEKMRKACIGNNSVFSVREIKF